MSKDQKELRSIQIAATIIYRYMKDVRIESVSNPFYDLIVTIIGKGVSFGVETKSSTYSRSQSFQDEVGKLYSRDYQNSENRLPILLMSVNESTETASLAFLVGLHLGRPVIFKNVELRAANQENFDKVKQAVIWMDSVIRFIEEKDWNVLKQIHISKKIGERYVNAEILYLRKFGINYRMQNKEISDEKQKIERLIKGIPEDEYPSDVLDNKILAGVEKQYKGARCNSRLILLNTDIQDLQILKQYKMVESQVLMLPDIQGLFINGKIIPKTFNAIRIPIWIFVEDERNAQYFADETYEDIIPLDTWVEDYLTINNLQETIHPVTELLV